MIWPVLFQTFIAFWATLGIAVLFCVPKSELLYSGAVGAAGWFVYSLTLALTNGTVIATLLATVVITLISRILTRPRKMPITLFLISGIIPLVPGVGVYGAMYHVIAGNAAAAGEQGLFTLKISGAIAFGIMLMLSLPTKWFAPKRE